MKSFNIHSLNAPLGFKLDKKASFDQKQLRKALGQFKTGVIVASTCRQGFFNRAQEFIRQTDFGGNFIKQFAAKIAPASTALGENILSKKRLQIFKYIDLFIKSRVFEKDLIIKFKKLFSTQLAGMTINSFTSVSLNPPLVSFCIDNRSANLEIFKKSKFFALNILSFEQQGLANAFAKPANPSKWQYCEFAMSAFGNPIFRESLAIIECKRHRIMKMGDHHILFGEVIGFYLDEDSKKPNKISDSEDDTKKVRAIRPLAYWRGSYES